MPDSTPGREDDGTFTPEVDDDEILDAVAELEPAGTVDVGEAVGLARQNADYRLRQLRDEGRVESVKIGGALVWSTASTEQGDTDSEDSRRPGGEEEAQPEREPEPQPTPEKGEAIGGEPSREPGGDLEDVVERVADGWEDSPERLAARKAAARGVLEYAQEHGGVSKKEATEQLYAEYPVDGQSADTWYRKNIRPVLQEAAEYNAGTHQYELAIGE